MLLYRCNNGQTIVDETSDWLYDQPQVEEYYHEDQVDPQDITQDMTMSWSGTPWSYWETTDTHHRPNINFMFEV